MEANLSIVTNLLAKTIFGKLETNMINLMTFK